MSDDDWHRRTSWSDEDRDAFYSRLSRCRSESTRTQALRIQATTLSEHGRVQPAVELLDQLLAEHPDDYFRGMTYTQRAECFEALGEVGKAIADFQAALSLQSGECPNVHTTAWLDYPWLVVKHGLTERFDEVLTIIEVNEVQQSLVFPAATYICEAVRALICDARNERFNANQHAIAALSAADTKHSRLPRHPDIGLVTQEKESCQIHRRLVELAQPMEM